MQRRAGVSALHRGGNCDNTARWGGRIAGGYADGRRNGDGAGADGQPERARAVRHRQRHDRARASPSRPSACPTSTRPTVSIRDTTLAILAGFAFNRRVMIQGYHGTGKSTHIEQVAARLNWPCVRVNLDSHISRIDLIGKDAIGSATACRSPSSAKASCPGRCSNPSRWCFDEYDAGRPGRDVRDPARARGRGQADAARPEPRDPAAPVLPAVLDGQHRRPRRHDRPLPRHPADQPGPDGPLEHRRRRSTTSPHDVEAEIVLAKYARVRDARGPQDRQPAW